MSANFPNEVVASVAQLLQQTLVPSTQKQAEHALLQYEGQPGFVDCLLHLLESSVDPAIKMSAAIYFKNFILKYWPESTEQNQKLSNSARVGLKNTLVDILIRCPNNLRIQLSSAIACIAYWDFPFDWENFLPEVNAKLATADPATRNALLQALHQIFKRYRSEMRSDDLLREIKYVINTFGNTLIQLYQSANAAVEAATGNKIALENSLMTIFLLNKIFYSLSFQDFPEFFEDNLVVFMNIFEKYYVYTNPVCKSDDDDEAGILEKVQGSTAEIINLYASRYEEDFPMLPKFINLTWSLLMSLTDSPKNDVLAGCGMKILSTVAKLQQYSSLFKANEAISQICERIILPNIKLRDSDIEILEDEPLEYIRRDLEGSEGDSRRSNAAELIKSLMILFETEISSILTQFINFFIEQYKINPQTNWKLKDAAEYLFTAIAIKTFTNQKGATSIHQATDPVKFFSEIVFEDLQSTATHLILKVDAIKYIQIFRNQLTKEQLLHVMPLLVAQISSGNPVVYTYAASAIEKILAIRRNGTSMFSPADVSPFALPMIQNLLTIVLNGAVPEKIAENDYLIRAVMRLIVTSAEEVGSSSVEIAKVLCSIISEICKNPSNPHFNHYLFESLAGLVRFGSQKYIQQLEVYIFPVFQNILTNDIVEFVPYVFQILSQMLECQPASGSVPEAYQSLFPLLLQPALWSSHGNVPALIRLLQAYIHRSPEFILANQHLNAILAIYQTLIASKLHDVFGFQLLMTLMSNLKIDILSPYISNLVILILKRMQSAKTPRFITLFFKFICQWINNKNIPSSCEYLIHVFTSIQPDLFHMVTNSVILPQALKTEDLKERQHAIVALTRLATCKAILENPNNLKLWPEYIIIASQLLNSKPPKTIDEDLEELLLEKEELGYQAAFARLSVLPKEAVTMEPVPDAMNYFKQNMTSLISTNTLKFKNLLEGKPADQLKPVFQLLPVLGA